MTAKYRTLLVVVMMIPAGSGVVRAQNDGGKTGYLQQLRIQDEESLRATPGARFHGGLGRPLPNVELPAHVPAPDGEFSFFADFGNSDPKGVPLFLVNRTGKPIDINSQDHDPNLTLEYLDEHSRWKRAQVHIASDCGNSYYPLRLLPGQHFHFSGYRPAEGRAATVRYRSNPTMTSNVGQGFVIPADISAAEVDDFEANAIPRGLREVLMYTRSFSQNEPVVPGRYAAALKLLSKYTDNAYYRREAKRYLEGAKPDPKEVSRISAILGTRWPAERESLALFKSALSEGGELTDFPELRWGVILELLEDHESERTGPLWNDAIRQAYVMLPKALKSANNAEVEAAASILAIPSTTDEYVATSDLRGWLEHANSAVVRSCANALSRRGERDFLAEKGSELSPESRILILSALASGGFSERGMPRNPESSLEKDFWKSCASKYPRETVSGLYYIGVISPDYNRFDMVLHDPLRDFLEKEAELAEKSSEAVANEEHVLQAVQVVRFVGAWKRDGDIPIFRRLLKHPGYQKGIEIDSLNRRFEYKRLLIRIHAKNVLKTMGVFVGDDVVLEEKTPLPLE